MMYTYEYWCDECNEFVRIAAREIEWRVETQEWEVYCPRCDTYLGEFPNE
jgi:Zn finger protein HypA/HybF involved in hydrogenase expression